MNYFLVPYDQIPCSALIGGGRERDLVLPQLDKPGIVFFPWEVSPSLRSGGGVEGGTRGGTVVGM